MPKGCIDIVISPVTCTFFIVNFIFFFLGIAALSLGGVILFDNNSLEAVEKLDETGAINDIKVSGFVKNLATIFMIVGGSLLFIGFLGCFGVAIGITCFIYMYCIIFGLLVLAQIAALGFVYFQKDALMSQIKDLLKDAVKNFQGIDAKAGGSDNPSRWESALNLIQKYLECCGEKNGNDFRTSKWFNSTRRPSSQLVPVSCCELKDKSSSTPKKDLCTTSPIGSDNPYSSQGCYDAMKIYIFKRGIVAVVVSTITMALQLFAICYAAIIEKSFSDDELVAKLNKK